VDAAALPLDPAAAAWFESAKADPLLAAVSGGDDYELLFAVPRKARGRLRMVQSLARGVPITHIGELTADPAIQLLRGGAGIPMPEGFSHFHATNH
jgi:thiamine-monophosphate kinase